MCACTCNATTLFSTDRKLAPAAQPHRAASLHQTLVKEAPHYFKQAQSGHQGMLTATAALMARGMVAMSVSTSGIDLSTTSSRSSGSVGGGVLQRTADISVQKAACQSAGVHVSRVDLSTTSSRSSGSVGSEVLQHTQAHVQGICNRTDLDGFWEPGKSTLSLYMQV
jgi:hypothetical protein